MSKAQAERAIPALQAMRNLVEGAPPPQATDLQAWGKVRESILSQLDNQLRHAQMKLGRAETRPSRPPRQQGGTGRGPSDRGFRGGGREGGREGGYGGGRDSGRPPRPHRF